jgi:small redox-active disulfide protein 2
MTVNKIKQIAINDRLIGLIGLDDAVKMITADYEGLTDNEIQIRLLELVSVDNYIPVNARDAYGQAMLREFKMAQGLAVHPEISSGLTITILGMGCARCNQLESDIRDLLSEMKIAADLRHITDLQEIARYGVMGSPALVINNIVLSAGEVPSKAKIRQWIIEAHDPPDRTDKQT